jgi:hypothetical protein
MRRWDLIEARMRNIKQNPGQFEERIDRVQCQNAGIGPISWHRALSNALLILPTIWICREFRFDSTPMDAATAFGN